MEIEVIKYRLGTQNEVLLKVCVLTVSILVAVEFMDVDDIMLREYIG